MKRSIELVVFAAVVLLIGFATSALAQVRSPRTPGVTVNLGPAATSTGVGRVFVPPSSIAQPGSAGVSMHTNVEVFIPEGFKPGVESPPFSGYGYNTPASYMCRYNFPTSAYHVAGCNPNNTALLTLTSGGGQTIAIVDAFDDPWIAVDLAYFSAAFGIPFSPSQIQVVYAAGYEPPEDYSGGWELEESLDVEWAHAMAPNANIILVEAASNSITDLAAAVTVASNEVVCGATTCPSGGTGKGEVSMSWGGGEFSGETSYDSYFTTANVVYFAASGDSPGVSYPCASPNVVCVGGTTFSRNPSTLNGEQEGVWEEAGSGQSAVEALPSYQSGITGTLTGLASLGFNTTNRLVPDVSANANPNTGEWVFDSFEFELLGRGSAPAGWWVVGGTSVSTPIVAAMVNYTGSFLASSTAELTLFYGSVSGGGSTVNSANFGDILGGYGVCGPYQGYVAAAGVDPCTGIGTPNGTSGK